MRDNVIYFLIPLSKLTDEIIRDSCLSSRETSRQSIRPIRGEYYVVVPFMTSLSIPEYMNSKTYKQYRSYSNEEVRAELNKPEWNFNKEFEDLIVAYNVQGILDNFDNQNYIQSFGEMYIFIFQILRFKFFIHSKEYLDTEHKWKVFSSGSRFEKANENTMLELNYFYNLISKEDKDLIEKFRLIRNEVSHNFIEQPDKKRWRNSIVEIDTLIQKYFDLVMDW